MGKHDEYRRDTWLVQKGFWGKKKDSSGKSDGDLNSLIAALVENTSETRETINRYTIGQLESLAMALSKNHEDPDKPQKEEKKLVDGDAIRYLMKNGGDL